MTLDELEWSALVRADGSGDAWLAKVYLLDDMLRIYIRGDGLYDIMMGTPDEGSHDGGSWYRLDALTAQCVLNHLTQGRNDDAG